MLHLQWKDDTYSISWRTNVGYTGVCVCVGGGRSTDTIYPQREQDVRISF